MKRFIPVFLIAAAITTNIFACENKEYTFYTNELKKILEKKSTADTLSKEGMELHKNAELLSKKVLALEGIIESDKAVDEALEKIFGSQK